MHFRNENDTHYYLNAMNTGHKHGDNALVVETGRADRFVAALIPRATGSARPERPHPSILGQICAEAIGIAG
jgi:hypothetical protein